MNTNKALKPRITNLMLAGMLAGSAISCVHQAPPPPAASAAVPAAAPGAAPPITRLTTVDVTQTGNPPTGPHAIIIEHDPGLPAHTIYRPRELGSARHPVMVWGEGGCAKNGLTFPEFLSEIASHGVVVLADGPPVPPRPRAAGGPNGPGAAGGPGGPGGARPAGAPPGAGPAGGPGAGGVPRIGGMTTDGTDLIKALDWLEAESTRRGSRFQNKVDVKRVAAMGMSCGGLMAYGASADPRIATVGIWNSGLTQPDPKLLDKIHSSVIIVTGNETDVAYANGKRDFETMPAKVPVFYATHAPVGHGGTYNQDNGGSFGPMAVAWLKWQLQGDKGATGRGYFVGDTCAVCRDSTWAVKTRALP